MHIVLSIAYFGKKFSMTEKKNLVTRRKKKIIGNYLNKNLLLLSLIPIQAERKIIFTIIYFSKAPESVKFQTFSGSYDKSTYSLLLTFGKLMNDLASYFDTFSRKT